MVVDRPALNLENLEFPEFHRERVFTVTMRVLFFFICHTKESYMQWRPKIMSIDYSYFQDLHGHFPILNELIFYANNGPAKYGHAEHF